VAGGGAAALVVGELAASCRARCFAAADRAAARAAADRDAAREADRDAAAAWAAWACSRLPSSVLTGVIARRICT
jgi:hypothetical protein